MHWLLVLLIVYSSCSYFQSNGFEITVDMSLEHDEGRFNPELGDVVSIVGSFNDWELNTNTLEDPEGDWVYSISMAEIPDTLEFKFVVTSTSNLDLPNSGWEMIPNRKLAKETLESDKPTLRFNKPWSPIEVMDISFAVMMSNQEILEFFDPDKDQVVVTGSFIGWDSNGITLEDANEDGVYEQTIPIEITPVKPHAFKYRINKHSSFDGYIPNDGWEFIDDRILLTQGSEVHYFNDQKRVARFLVNKHWIQRSTKKDSQLGDMYQVRFFVGEESYLSEPLQKGMGDFYETSLQIPLVVDKVKWTVVKNQTKEITDIHESIVTHKGAIITVE